ncbi:bifunctional glycoside hydrolase 114/ polysaccharide deacetylase family protein [Solimonas marina]|uniref:Glycoside-hydrolase family GH114 TIM-barrel domain-containing protein n=1 Tax=Solimonas marina TaxID=2714601 RepID=A0A969W7H8_9GAMM|nr:endo alpha-1,4 polygalactosaminidase [Solimonas marina]NKF20913.1 hypothetical protein [Solimonas marina]
MTRARLLACCWLLLLIVPLPGRALERAPSTAFYYGSTPPTALLSQFDQVVVEPAHIDAAQRAALTASGATLFAYLSVGEIDRHDQAAMQLAPQVARGRNAAWDSSVVDLTSPIWRQFIVDRADRLWQQGFHALFLDTLDSYQLIAHDPAARQQQQAALIDIIRAIHAAHPDIKLMLNRGFEIVPAVRALICGVAAESLFSEWAPTRKRYQPVADDDRKALLEQLRHIRDDDHLPVVVIDYVAPKDRDRARALARRIDALGFTPWVSNGDLDGMGVGAIEVMPRKVLMLYALNGSDDDLAYSAVHNYAAMPLEYLGYAADYRDVDGPLPEGELRGRYAGIVIWLNRAVPSAGVRQWLARQIDDGVPIAVLGDPGVAIDSRQLQKMGLRTVADIDSRHETVIRHDAMLGFETFPDVPPASDNGFRATRDDVSEHLLLEDARHQRYSPVVTGPWGGFALAPWVIEEARNIDPQSGDDGESSEWRQRWIIDPFAFFKTALHLPTMPVPDATTENGNRYLTVHIDGDGFANRASMPGTPYVSDVIMRHELQRRPLPTTVSVIEGEVGPSGLYPDQSPALEKIARQIFRLPNVEIATHTFSHPFDWQLLHDGQSPGDNMMPIPGYHFSMQREIAGSADYIADRLAPPGKPVKMVLWSGNALPKQNALADAAQRGLLNMNGGNTDISRDNDTLTAVSPMTRPVGPYTQVYAPVINENVYTNGYKAPLWGFRHAIETFELTDRPRRLKPIGIYYHFFSATHLSSLHALDAVYDYAESQRTLPLYGSQYVKVALDFADVGIARRLDGDWQISGATDVRTLRLPDDLGTPDLARSPGVAGLTTLPQARYLSLSGAARIDLALQRGRSSSGVSLLHANGRIVDWLRHGRGADLQLRGNVPLHLELGGLAPGCRIDAPRATVDRHGATATLRYTGKDSGHVSVDCD